MKIKMTAFQKVVLTLTTVGILAGIGNNILNQQEIYQDLQEQQIVKVVEGIQSNQSEAKKIEKAMDSKELLTLNDYKQTIRGWEKLNDKINPLGNPSSSLEVKYVQYKYHASDDVWREVVSQYSSLNPMPEVKTLKDKFELIDQYVKAHQEDKVVKDYVQKLDWAKETYLVKQENVVIVGIKDHFDNIAIQHAPSKAEAIAKIQKARAEEQRDLAARSQTGIQRGATKG